MKAVLRHPRHQVGALRQDHRGDRRRASCRGFRPSTSAARPTASPASRCSRPRRCAAYEPNCRAVRALHVPETGIVDYVQVAAKMGELLQQRGVRDPHRRRRDRHPPARGARSCSRPRRARWRRSTSSTAPGCTPTGWRALMGVDPGGADHPVPRRVLHAAARAPLARARTSSTRSRTPSSRSWASTSRAPSTATWRRGRTRCWPSRARATPSARCGPARFMGTLGYAGFWHMARTLLADGRLRDVPLGEQGGLRALAAEAGARHRGVRGHRARRGGGARAGGEPRTARWWTTSRSA